MKKLRKIVLRVFIFTSLGILLLGAAAYTLSLIYEKELKNYVINSINEKFSARIDVENIDLSFWRKFPYASLRFSKITITDNHLHENPPILVAKNLFLQFNINDIIQKKFILRKVEVIDGKIDLVIYAGGKNNFNLFQESADTSGSFFLSAHSFLMKNMILSYENQSTAQFFEAEAIKMEMPFELNSEGLKTGLNGAMTINVLRSEGVDLLSNIECTIKSGLSYKTNSQTLTIDPSVLTANGIPMNLSGYFKIEPNQIATQVQIKTENLPISTLLEMMPDNLLEMPISIEKTGILNLNIDVNGHLGGKVIPAVSGSFSLKNASFTYHDNDVIVNKINLDGKFNNGKRGAVETASITINKFSGIVNGSAFEGNLSLVNLKNPLLNLATKGSIDLAFAHKIFEISFFEIMEGSLVFDLQFAGSPTDLTSIESFKNSRITGDYSLKNARFKIVGQNIIYSDAQANGTINPVDFSFSHFILSADGSRLEGKGSVANYLELFTEKSTNTLKLDLIVSANDMSFDKLMNIISIEGDESESTLSLMTNISFKVDRFDYDKIRLDNASGVFQYFDGEWSIQNARFKLDEGFFNGSLVSKPGSNANSLYYIDGHFEKLNIQQLFVTFNNFDQDIITNKNIKGIANGSLRMQMAMDKNGNLINKSLIAKTDFVIHNGNLVNVEQLKSLSSYTRIDDFSNINFSTLSNSITIENEIITIPKMEIKSDKLDLELYGTHNFENEYDYHLNVLVSDLLGRKVKKTTENEFGIIEEDGNGKKRLFIRIVGKGENFEVKYDRKEVSAKISTDLKAEGKDVKSALNNEFINPERDKERKAKKAIKEAEIENLKRQENGEFIIKWDESDTIDSE